MIRFSFFELMKRVELRVFGRYGTTHCYNRPQFVVIEPTTRCNLSCIWCARPYRNYPIRDMSVSDFQGIIQQIGYVREIVPFGFGEPLLHKQIDKIISLASKNADYTWINSNGILLDQKMTRRLDSSGLTELALSIDSPDPEIFNQIRKGADLDKIKENARHFTDHSTIPLRIHAVLSALTLDSSLNLPMMAHELGANKLTFNILHPTPDKHLMPNPQKLLHTCEKLHRLCLELGLKTDITEILKKQSTNLCKAPLLSTFIDSEGYMTPCCNYPQFRLGNVFDKGFEECWNAEETRRFRKRVLRGNFPEWCQTLCLSVRHLISTAHA
ncbi:MAG: radical SAM protein, partial [Candidatus Bathyarchaeota archaeon]|nr:radical SAM protein [Candidatus Bathyarchaeota archaeon]